MPTKQEGEGRPAIPFCISISEIFWAIVETVRDNGKNRFEPWRVVRLGDKEVLLNPGSLNAISPELYSYMSIETTPDTLEADRSPSNVQLARERGIRPLTIQDILRQIDPKDLLNLVFFDTPDRIHPGNHWRVTQVDRDETDIQQLHLQYTNAIGSGDFLEVPPQIISAEAFTTQPLFTGLHYSEVEYQGKAVDLNTVNQLMQEAKRRSFRKRKFEYPVGLQFTESRIYFADASGTLIAGTRAPETQLHSAARVTAADVMQGE